MRGRGSPAPRAGEAARRQRAAARAGVRARQGRAERSSGGASAADGGDDRSPGSARGSGPGAASVLCSNRGTGRERPEVRVQPSRSARLPPERGCGRGSCRPGAGSAGGRSPWAVRRGPAWQRQRQCQGRERGPSAPVPIVPGSARPERRWSGRAETGRGRSTAGAFVSVVCGMLAVLAGGALDSEPISFLAASGAASALLVQ